MRRHLITVFLTFVLLAGSPVLALAKGTSTKNKPSTDWSRAMVESTMKRYPTAKDLGTWGYAKSLYLWGQYLVWQRTKDPRYLEYIKAWVDFHVDSNGVVTNTNAEGKVSEITFDNLDSMLP